MWAILWIFFIRAPLALGNDDSLTKSVPCSVMAEAATFSPLLGEIETQMGAICDRGSAACVGVLKLVGEAPDLIAPLAWVEPQLFSRLLGRISWLAGSPEPAVAEAAKKVRAAIEASVSAGYRSAQLTWEKARQSEQKERRRMWSLLVRRPNRLEGRTLTPLVDRREAEGLRRDEFAIAQERSITHASEAVRAAKYLKEWGEPVSVRLTALRLLAASLTGEGLPLRNLSARQYQTLVNALADATHSQEPTVSQEIGRLLEWLAMARQEYGLRNETEADAHRLRATEVAAMVRWWNNR